MLLQLQVDCHRQASGPIQDLVISVLRCPDSSDFEFLRSARPAGYRRNNRDFRSILCGRTEVLQEPNVFTIHIYVDEATQPAGIIADAVSNSGELALEPVDHFFERACLDLDDFRTAGMFSKGSGDHNLK